jgi:hypothetical protein
VLAKLPEHPINQIQHLLPWNLAPSLHNDLPELPKAHATSVH